MFLYSGLLFCFHFGDFNTGSRNVKYTISFTLKIGNNTESIFVFWF